MAVMEERLSAIEQLLERAVQPDGGLHQRNVKEVPREDKDTADEVQPETAVAASWDMPRHCRQPAAKEQQQLTPRVNKEDKDRADKVQLETSTAASWEIPRHHRRSAAKAQQQLTRVQRPQAS